MEHTYPDFDFTFTFASSWNDFYSEPPVDYDFETSIQFNENDEYEMHTKNKFDPKRKHNNPFGSNTARQFAYGNAWWINMHPEVIWADVVEEIDGFTSIKYKSVVDDRLDISKPNRYGNRFSVYRGPTRLLNQKSMLAKKNTWDVIDTMESECIKKITRHHPNADGQRIAIYTLPAVESVLQKEIPEAKFNRNTLNKKKKETRWMVIDGVKYDTDLIHTSTFGISFTPYGVYNHVEPPVGSERLKGAIDVKFDTKSTKSTKSIKNSTDVDRVDRANRVKKDKKNRHDDRDSRELDICMIDTRRNICSTDMHKGHMNKMSEHRLPICTRKVIHVDVDLGKNMQIDAVSTMGRNHEIHSRLEYDIDHWSAMYVNKRIKFVREKESHFVTSFALLYRQHGSKNWISLGNLSGNADRLTEVLTKFDLVARYLRFVPLTYTRSPSFQIGVFGKDILCSVPKASIERKESTEHVSHYSSKTPKKNKKDLIIDDEIKTIDYEVQLPNKKNFYVKTQRRKPIWMYENTRVRRNENRHSIHQNIREELDIYHDELDGKDQSMYDFDRDCDYKPETQVDDREAPKTPKTSKTLKTPKTPKTPKTSKKPETQVVQDNQVSELPGLPGLVENVSIEILNGDWQ